MALLTEVFGLAWSYLPAICLGYIVVHVLHNHYQKGLNKYPGPFIASLTNWWRVYIVAQRRAELTHIALHQKYGDVVRLGPNFLSFSNPDALKTIYGLNKGFTKSEFYPVQQAVSGGHRLPSLFSTTDESFHARLRRCVNSAFSMSTLIQYEPFVTSTTELFLSQTEKLYCDAAQKGCDFSKWLQFYAFDVIGEMTYSKRHGFLEKNEDVEGIVAYLGGLFDYVAPIGQLPILDLFWLKNPVLLWAARTGIPGFGDVTFPVAKFAKERMKERISDEKAAAIQANSNTIDQKGTLHAPPTPPATPPSMKAKESIVATSEKAPQMDLLAKFMQAKIDRPEFMTDGLVMTMAVSMAFAGSETTAISLSSIFYFLLKNPRCLAKVYEELDAKARAGYFQDNESGLVSWHESQGLEYLDAVVKESFRIHPAPGLHLERVVPEQGVEISGEFIQGGTIVGASAWVLHRTKEIFGNDVETFRPERWLVGQGESSGSVNGLGNRDRKDSGVDMSAEGDLNEKQEAWRKAEEKRIKEMGACLLHFGAGARTCIGKNISLLEVYKLVPSFLRRFEVSHPRFLIGISNCGVLLVGASLVEKMDGTRDRTD
ncbi:pisatin demethylase [Tricladium varicosporioides]|nr:pisatin demethylase [Hymenoscyphus varicosporioides]